MPRRLRSYLGRQKLIPWVGEFKETLAQAMFWASIINFLMVAGTFYFTTLRHIAPWFKLWMFIVFGAVGIVVIFVVEFKYVVPSIWAFRGRQMDLRNASPKKEEHE